MDAQEVLTFWFETLTPEDWFKKDPELDETIKLKFADTLTAAHKSELYSWRETAEGRLAEIIVLDQFSRNIHRDRPESFENDSMALTLAQEMVHLGLDQKLPVPQRTFAYMPYMHSESARIHEVASALFSVKGMEDNYRFELAHKEIIDRFGRFPHRNSILHRSSTPEELEFIKTHKGF